MMPTEIAFAAHCDFGAQRFSRCELAQIEFLPVMHQHVEHDIFRHPLGEVGDRDAHQRHVGQGRIRHQRIDAGAEIEDDAQVRECGEFARARLPDRGIVDLSRIERGIRQQQHAAARADVVEPALPSHRRPVFGPAMHQQSERTLVHSPFLVLSLNVILIT